jgi:hypothetical protein
VISNGLYSLTDLDGVFLQNSSEAIWQLQNATIDGFNTQEAKEFVLPSTGPDGIFHFSYLSDSLVASFEAGDARKDHWVGAVTSDGTTYHFPYKYKNDSLNAPPTEYSTVLRLAEQFLIRSEARAQNDDLTGSAEDLNVVRNRAGLLPTDASNKQDMLSAILKERRFEFFAEWGHRWFDLKRTNQLDAVMGNGGVCSAKGGVWSNYKQLMPIPLTELSADPNLVQNPGC